MTTVDEPAGSSGTGDLRLGDGPGVRAGSDRSGVHVAPGRLGEAELVGLARRCHQVDGGLPLATEPAFLRRRWFVPGAVTFAARTADGGLAGALAVRPAAAGPMVTGLVDPAWRGRGIGSQLLDLGLAVAEAVPVAEDQPGVAGVVPVAEDQLGVAGVVPVAEDQLGVAGAVPVAEDQPGAVGAVPVAEGRPAAAGVVVTVESEGVTGEAEALFGSRGLRRVFAEEVMRIDLAAASLPAATWPAGAAVVEWTTVDAGRFHAVYAAAFRDRPGFPDPPADQWISETAEDDGFRPDWSLLVSLPGRGDVGFVTAAEGWVVQIGVVPAARRAGLAEALLRESLGRMAADGFAEAWLDVNVDNPAAALYRRIGFRDMGRRARYQR